MKKKRKKRKNKTLTKKQLERLVVSIFKESPSKPLNHKQISKILNVKEKGVKSLIVDLLVSLSKNRIIKETKRGSYKLILSTKKTVGKVVSVMSSGIFLDSDDFDEEIFIPLEYSLFALKNDLVEVQVFPNKKGGLRGEIISVLERKKTLFVGSLHRSRGFAFLVSNRSVPFDIFIPNLSSLENFSSKKILVEVVCWNNKNKNPEGKIIKVIGKTNDHNTEIHSILYQHDLDPLFPKTIENISRSISEKIPISEIKTRVDFRKTTTFTIDPKDAKDYDDALSVKKLNNGNWEVGIHIADVGFYVKENDPIDIEASKRSTSVYLVDRVVPMLPEVLSNNLCSLKQGVDRLCYSVILEIDNSSNVVSHQIKKTIIHSDKRFTYEEAQQIIDNQKGIFSEELHVLHLLSKKIRKKRFDSGSINFERDEVKFILDKNNNPVDVFFKKSIDTNHLVEEFMLITNKIISKEIGTIKKGEESKTFVYRVHDSPDEEKIRSLSNLVRKFGYSINSSSSKKLSYSLNRLLKKVKGNPESNLIETLSIRSMSKAEYSTNNIGHYGLNFQYYSHFTSPIRRYPDLIVHRLLENYLSGGKSVEKNKISKICKYCSEKEKDASLAERDSIKYMQTKFLINKIGDSFFGIISGVTEWGIYVEIEKNKCEGLVKISSIKGDYYIFNKKTYSIVGKSSKKKYQLGDRVKVKVISSNLETKQIDFTLVI